MNNLKGKVAYITGGSKGIGYGIAKTLLNNGMKVAISSRTIDAAKLAGESISKDSSKILAIESDVSSLAAEKNAVQSVIDHFGKLDVLVANAGVGHFVNIESMTEEELKIIQKYYTRLKIKTQKEESLQQSHSIDEAEHQHELKKDIEESIEETVTKK